MTHRSSWARLWHTDWDLQCTEFHHRDTLWSVKAVVLVSATRIYTYNVQNFTIGIHCDQSKQLSSSLPHGFRPTMYTVQISSQTFSIGIHCVPSKQLYSPLPHGLAPTMYRISPWGYIVITQISREKQVDVAFRPDYCVSYEYVVN